MENNKNKNQPNRPLIPKGTKLLGSEYIIDSYFKSGGMKTDLYLCHDENQPNKKLMAKIVYKNSTDDDAWNRVQAEAISALRVRNKPYLIQTYRVLKGKDEKDPFIIIIMDYVEGISLREYITIHGCMVPAKALAIFLKILKGVKSLHDFKHQIIHRDLKPENIIVSRDLSQVTTIDFGISTVVDTTVSTNDANANNKHILNDESKLYGTLEYIIPDVLKAYNPKSKERNVTVQADFFSLGVILYEMIIGKKPFDYSNVSGKNTAEIQSAQIKIPLRYDMLNISANPSIPVALENLIFRCIACKPEDIKYRYNSIDEIINDVYKVIPLLNKNDNTQLLKPICKRSYQKAQHFNTDVIRNRQKWYKQWWCFGVVSAVSLTILIACIVMFFVL